jgi:hypothetical protein
VSDAAPWEDFAAPTATPAASAAPATHDDAPWLDYGGTPEPQNSVGGKVRAVASGISSGVLDIAGLPMDTARNVLELGRAGTGFLSTVGGNIDYSVDDQGNPVALMPENGKSSTDKPVPSWLEPNTAPTVGGSEWLKQKVRGVNVGPLSGSAAIDVAPADDTMTNRLFHGAGEMVPGALTDNPAAVVGSVGRRVVTGAATGLAQQGAAEAGFDPTTQTAVAMLGGHAVGEAAAARAAARAASVAKAQPRPVESTGGFSVTPSDVPGEVPAINVGGRTTAADHNIAHEFVPPTSAGVERPAAPMPEQDVRAQTLRNIGLQEARESAITGDTREAGTDFQTSKVDSTHGKRMGDVIDNERTALQNYAGQLRENSAGAAGIDDEYTRGATIAKPVEQLRDYFDDQTKQHYTAADAKAQGTPIEFPETQQVLGAKSEFLGTVEGKQLREGVQSRLRDLGMMDEDGNLQHGTAKQAEAFKQYLNDQWSPRTGRLITKLKNAVDADVTKNGGADVYDKARQTRAQRSVLLDDPTGISKLAPPTDRLGINRAVPLENVPNYVTSLPLDQFKHFVGTLRGVPTIAPGETALHTAATDALNEIRAHFSNKIESAGNSTQNMWNAKAVNAYLRTNQARMAHVFSPVEMQQFKTLNDAGNILRMDRTYPGAAAQEYNLRARGVLAAGKLVGKAGFAGGLAATHGAEGGATGHVIGKGVESAAEKLAARSMRSAVEKRIRKL